MTLPFPCCSTAFVLHFDAASALCHNSQLKPLAGFQRLSGSRTWWLLFDAAAALAVGETVTLMTPPFSSILKHLLKLEGGAAD